MPSPAPGWRHFSIYLVLALAVLGAIWLPFLSSSRVDDGWGDWTQRANYLSYTLHAFRERTFPYVTFQDEYRQYWFKDRIAFFANPETEVLSPYLPFYVLFSFKRAVNLVFIVHLLIGCAGLYLLLTQVLRIARLQVLVGAAVLLYGNGAFVRHLLVGHFQFVSATYFPLVLWALLKKDLTLWGPVFSGALLALAFYEGNVHPLSHFLILMLGLAICGASVDVRWRTNLQKCGIALLTFIGLSAFKLVPALWDFGGYRPEGLVAYANGFDLLDNILHYPDPQLKHSPPHEVSLYLGLSGVLLALPSIVNFQKRMRPFWIMALVFGIYLFGPYPDLASRIPILAPEAPVRFRGEWIFLIVLLAASQWETWSQIQWRGSAIVTGAFLVLLGLTVVGFHQHVEFLVSHYAQWGILIRPDLVQSAQRVAPSGAVEQLMQLYHVGLGITCATLCTLGAAMFAKLRTAPAGA